MLFALFALFALFSVVSAQTATDCTAFCTDYNMTCMGVAPANDIYMDMTACEKECMKFPMVASCATGDITDPTNCGSGNSWGCRRYHLNVAMDTADPTNPATHCPHTTPLSSPTADITAADAITMTQCGTLVNGTTAKNGLVADFCNQATTVCNSYLGGLDVSKCVPFYSHVSGNTDVANYPNGVNRKFPLVSTPGNGLPCRRYHVQVARESTGASINDHCVHALFGDGACGTTCETYCQMGESICPNDFDANCMTDCTNKVPEPVDFAVITNKDLVCRIYHMSVASQSAANAADHCSHATIMSTPETCGEDGAASLSISAFFIAALALITKFSS